MKLFGIEIGVGRDRMVVEVAAGGDTGRPDPKGDPIHAVCHGTCAERAKGI